MADALGEKPQPSQGEGQRDSGGRAACARGCSVSGRASRPAALVVHVARTLAVRCGRGLIPGGGGDMRQGFGDLPPV